MTPALDPGERLLLQAYASSNARDAQDLLCMELHASAWGAQNNQSNVIDVEAY
jgi:hypothetical protein